MIDIFMGVVLSKESDTRAVLGSKAVGHSEYGRSGCEGRGWRSCGYFASGFVGVIN